MTNPIIIKTSKELGELARSKRKAAKNSLQSVAESHDLGVRFLSEFERGKPTSEIGKVLIALHALGLDLAVIPQRSEKTSVDRLSKLLELEFPYDWSNPSLDESTFIQRVLERTRINDYLKIARYFGIDRLESEAHLLKGIHQEKLIKKLLSRIRIGILKSEEKNK